MSAAKAEPVTIASAVANKATFFISIPITSSYPVGFPGSPPGVRPMCKIALPRQSVSRGANREAKNTGICRLFGRSSDSTKGCQPVLLLDHIICIAECTEGPGLVRKPQVVVPTYESCRREKGRLRPRRAAMQKGRSFTAAAFLLSIIVCGVDPAFG